MSPELIDILEGIKETIKDIALYVMPIAAFGVSVIALIKSNRSLGVKVQLSEMQEQLINYELAIKRYEYEKMQACEQKKACVEARIINIAKNKYKLKVWNSGDIKVYNVNVTIPAEYSITIMKGKMPFEYLEPGNSFEENVIVHMGSARKFKINITWEDKQGNRGSNEQIRDC